MTFNQMCKTVASKFKSNKIYEIELGKEVVINKIFDQKL